MYETHFPIILSAEQLFDIKYMLPKSQLLCIHVVSLSRL